MINTLFFDLDGTLLDTAPDLANALNTLLTEQQHPILPFEQIRPVVSHGGKGLLKLGFNMDESHPRYESLRERLLAIYAATIADQTTLFDGMSEVLDFVETANMTWGIITNKPAWLTEPLLKKINLFDRSACVISGDSLKQSKPHPAPIFHAMKLCHREVHECVYIGDAERDIQAGQSAGMMTVAASYGYIPSDENVYAWNADMIIDKPVDILDWLKSNTTS